MPSLESTKVLSKYRPKEALPIADWHIKEIEKAKAEVIDRIDNLMADGKYYWEARYIALKESEGE